MNDVISLMLARYPCQSANDYHNALKEIIQEIALLGLWRSKFFEKAAFYGGTALRILYGLDRFSEDLDFSLLKPNPHFRLTPYLSALKAELDSFGFQVSIDEKTKKSDSTIQSAFIKTGTQGLLLDIKVPPQISARIHSMHLLKIKLEIDIDPPAGFETEVKYLLQPIPFSVNTYAPSDLFAGKIHALLCRPWRGRVKGRDWYDFVWYLGHNIPVHLSHLQNRLIQTNAWPQDKMLTAADLHTLLIQKIDHIDFKAAQQEVAPFLKDPHSVALWSPDFFKTLTKKIQVLSS